MKTLLILRHAKAQDDSPSGRDRDRALSGRGERDAARMGRHIHTLAGCPDAVVTSDARRAQQTADLAAAELGFPETAITEEPAIYGADVDTLLECVQRLPEAATSVLMVGHNPGFEGLAIVLSGSDSH